MHSIKSHIILLALTTTIKNLAFSETIDFLLPHLNWLEEFSNCFNTFVGVHDVTFYPDNYDSSNNPKSFQLAPIVYLKNNNKSTMLPVSFNKWTNCQTLSFIISFEFSTAKDVSKYLDSVYKYLGFEDAYYCIQFGHYCSQLQIATSYNQVAMHPLTLFYILLESEFNYEFEDLDYFLIFNNPFLHIPYKITYPVHKTDSEEGFVIGRQCLELVFMCKYCSYSQSDYMYDSFYDFYDIPTPCPLKEG